MPAEVVGVSWDVLGVFALVIGGLLTLLGSMIKQGFKVVQNNTNALTILIEHVKTNTAELNEVRNELNRFSNKLSKLEGLHGVKRDD